VNETLVHTYDIIQGLGIDWRPTESLCAAVLARLFPDAPAGDPVQVLLWSTGRRISTAGLVNTSWVMKAATGGTGRDFPTASNAKAFVTKPRVRRSQWLCPCPVPVRPRAHR